VINVVPAYAGVFRAVQFGAALFWCAQSHRLTRVAIGWSTSEVSQQLLEVLHMR